MPRKCKFTSDGLTVEIIMRDDFRKNTPNELENMIFEKMVESIVENLYSRDRSSQSKHVNEVSKTDSEKK